MAQWWRAIVTIPHTNGLPRDAAQNSFAFVTAGSGDRDLIASEIDTRLTGFYNAWVQYGGSSMDWYGVTVKVYDMTDDTPRYPFWESALTLTPGSSVPNDLPSEVAICLSFEGDKVSGTNQRRRRGRVYLGPLQLSSEDYNFANSALRTAITTGANTHLLNPSSSLSDWAVYSRSTHYGKAVGEPIVEGDEEVPDALPASFTVVTKAWVDDAFDTQRRRGRGATTRTTIVAS